MSPHRGTTAIRNGAEDPLPKERFLNKISSRFFCLIWAALFLLSSLRSSCRAFFVKTLAEVLPANIIAFYYTSKLITHPKGRIQIWVF
jgi:hypothetical protein